MNKNKLKIIIDGQFGSTGKGLLAEHLCRKEFFDLAASNLSPNAGHTFFHQGEFHVSKQIPVAGVIHDRSTIYLSPGSIIDVELLEQEIEKFNIDPTRIFVHPRAAIIEKSDRDHELQSDSSMAKIASTQSGVGSALARKILRTSELAQGNERLNQIVEVKGLDIMNMLDIGCNALMETSQGFDLGIDSGLSYPHCTSRDVSVATALANAQVHPSYLGEVLMSMRSFPIRVGHLYDGDEIIGHSGPFYKDSIETCWGAVGVDEERTTVTNRVRRVALFSLKQYERSLHYLRPDTVFLNFANYLSYVPSFLNRLCDIRVPDLIGFGRESELVVEVKSREDFLEMIERSAGEIERGQHNISKRCIF